MKEIVAKMEELGGALVLDAKKAADGNKTAGARARKASIELEKLMKEFRKASIAAEKK